MQSPRTATEASDFQSFYRIDSQPRQVVLKIKFYEFPVKNVKPRECSAGIFLDMSVISGIPELKVEMYNDDILGKRQLALMHLNADVFAPLFRLCHCE